MLRVLDSILRCTYDVDELLAPPVIKKDEWVHRELSGLDIWKEIQDGSLPKAEEKEALTQRFRLRERYFSFLRRVAAVD